MMDDPRPNSVRTPSRAFKSAGLFFRTSWRLVLVVSLLSNLGLGLLNFVFQPIWKAAAVTSAVAATQARAELAERKKIAKLKADAEIAERKSVEAAKTKERAKAKAEVAKEKAKGRVRRIAVSVPIAGSILAAGFEYRDYSEWKRENPHGSMQEYSQEVVSSIGGVVNEVLDELPNAIKPDAQRFENTFAAIIGKMSYFKEKGWNVPSFWRGNSQ